MEVFSEYILCFILFCIGLYCVLRRRNIIKIVIGLGIIEYAVNLFFVLVGYKEHGRAPILAKGQVVSPMVDPIPQALVLTSIVIGLAITALIVAIAVRIFEKYGTFDITKIRRLKG
ncbi:MAG: cation:proton antiporter [Omnitrophica WOR_2 bacterium RBG_13_44_8b]|nr:MAG: cation:proton antiporter [Omnitrophica WOR_2 bacterium RBG_13_44_8b]